MSLALKPIPPEATVAGQGMRRSRRPRRLAAIAFAILAILAIGWSGYWLLLTSRLEAGVQQWITERREQGYEVGYAAIRSGGFPLSAHVVLTNPAMATPANAPPLAWSAARLVVGVDPFHPRRLYIDSPGAHTLGIGAGSDQVRYHTEAGHLRVAQEIGEAAPTSVLNVRDLVLRPVAGEAQSETTIIARLDAKARRELQGSADGGSHRFVVTAAGMAFPQRPELPLGNGVESLAVDATVQGELALLPWRDALFRWRDEGGVIDVASLKMDYGPLALSGSGTVALDDAGQPVGAFTAQVSGLFQAIDALQARGHMGRGQAAAAKLALGVLAGRPDWRRGGPPGGQGPLNLPLTLQDRVLSVGPVALMPIPEVHWLRTTATP